MSFTKDVPSKNGVIQSFHEDESNVIPLLVFQTESTAPTDSNEVSESLVENDKIIFDELKTLIFQGYSENLLEKLIEFPNFPLNAQNDTDQYYTLLHHAAEKKSVDCLRILVTDFSAKTNIQADNGWTPIHLVVTSDCRCEPCTKKTLECLQILTDGGAIVDSEDDAGETPLYYAARNRLNKAAQFLLNNGANISHWGDGTSVATILAHFVPDVLKAEFDKRITIHERERTSRGLRLDFRLLLQDTAIHEGFTVKNIALKSSALPEKAYYSDGRFQKRKQGGSNENTTKAHKRKGRLRHRSRNDAEYHLPFTPTTLSQSAMPPLSSSSTSISSSNSESSQVVPPRETELLNYLLRADLAAIEAVVNHPFVEAFVHLKWLSVRKVFLFFRSLYLFLICLYTFYIFDTFVSATCFYSSAPTNGSSTNAGSATLIEKAKISGRYSNDTVDKATFGLFFPTASSEKVDDENYDSRLSRKKEWHSFSQYFKAHEMSCDPSTRTTILAYLFCVYVGCVILYELYKLCEGWYDYFKAPLNFAWWILAVNIGISLTPGLGLYAHTWHYPHAAFTLVFGWIFVLEQVGRIPYFGIFVGIFVKVLRDFCLLLFTFSPVLLAFALGFSVMLPQNEFFRFIPLGLFKVFMMMTGDVDFWGVFGGTWTSSTEIKGFLHIPLFIIYSVYILTVAMVLMSLLLGLAVDNIQEVRHEAALNRTVRLIQEIGILESILHKPALYYCGCSRYLRRLFSITSLDIMNGPELITYPEDPKDTSLPLDIKQKLIPYLLTTCCCSEDQTHNNYNESKNKRGRRRQEIANKREKDTLKSGKVFSHEQPDQSKVFERMPVRYTKSKELLRREYFEGNQNKLTNTIEVTPREMAYHDMMIYQEIKLLLEENEKSRIRLESLQKMLISRK